MRKERREYTIGGILLFLVVVMIVGLVIIIAIGSFLEDTWGW